MAFSNVTWAVFPKTVSADTSSDVTSKQNELKTLQQQIEETRSQLFTKKKEESNALAALENIELELERLQSRIDVQNKKLKTAEDNLATTEKGISNVEKQIDELANELDMRAEDISELMVKIYKTGPGTYLEVLFASNSLQDFVNRYEYLNMIVESDTDIFNEVKTQKSEVEAKKQELVALLTEQETKKKEIEEIKRELEAEEKEVSTALKEKEFYLKRVQAERERYEAELEEEERQSKALEQVIKDLQAKEKDSAKLSGYTSPFMWPTIDGRISSPYGWRVHPILGGNRYHSGLRRRRRKSIVGRLGDRIRKYCYNRPRWLYYYALWAQQRIEDHCRKDSEEGRFDSIGREHWKLYRSTPPLRGEEGRSCTGPV